jgi:hypothetical protein
MLREAGRAARRRPPRPSAPPRERARLSRRPGRGTGPRHSPLRTWWSRSHSPRIPFPALRVFSSRSPLRGLGPRAACRRRALESRREICHRAGQMHGQMQTWSDAYAGPHMQVLTPLVLALLVSPWLPGPARGSQAALPELPGREGEQLLSTSGYGARFVGWFRPLLKFSLD